jgi:hypothetical protein
MNAKQITVKSNKSSRKASKVVKPVSNGAVRYGINEAVRNILAKASAKKPLTRAAIFAKLLKMFPEHEELKIKHTLNGLISYHYTAAKGNGLLAAKCNPATGYWLAA